MASSASAGQGHSPSCLPAPLLQVNRPEVQRVLLTALLEDPNFQGLLQDRNQARINTSWLRCLLQPAKVPAGPVRANIR
jgi:hypothetical protein